MFSSEEWHFLTFDNFYGKVQITIVQMHLWAITLVLPALLISCAHSQQQQRQTSTVTQEKSSATYQTLPNPSTTSSAGTVGANNVYKDSYSGQSGQDILKYYSYPQPNTGANVQQQQQQYYSYYYPQHAAYNPVQGSGNVLGTERFGLGGSGGKGGDSGRGQGWGQAETPAPTYGPVQGQGWGQSQGDSQGSMNGFGGLGNILGGGSDSNGGGGILDGLTTMVSGMFSALGLGSDDMGSMDQMGYGNGGGWGQPMMMNDGGGGAGGGAGSIIGLLVGKKAGVLKTKALLLLLSPILIPLALLVIAAIVAIVLAIPIPVYMPSINDGRDLQGSLFQKSSALARTLLESESCVERIACEIMNTTKTYIPADWTQR